MVVLDVTIHFVLQEITDNVIKAAIRRKNQRCVTVCGGTVKIRAVVQKYLRRFRRARFLGRQVVASLLLDQRGFDPRRSTTAWKPRPHYRCSQRTKAPNSTIDNLATTRAINESKIRMAKLQMNFAAI